MGANAQEITRITWAICSWPSLCPLINVGVGRAEVQSFLPPDKWALHLADGSQREPALLWEWEGGIRWLSCLFLAQKLQKGLEALKEDLWKSAEKKNRCFGCLSVPQKISELFEACPLLHTSSVLKSIPDH